MRDKELLFNVVKHAGVDRARLSSTCERSGHLRITVSDEGKGFDPASLEGSETLEGAFGLTSIRHRLRVIDGAFEIESTPGEGTHAELHVPLRSPGTEDDGSSHEP